MSVDAPGSHNGCVTMFVVGRTPDNASAPALSLTRLPVGLWVPTNVAMARYGGTGDAGKLVVPAAAAPTGLGLFGVAPDEEALGWAVSNPETVRQFVETLPFEPAMVVLSRLEAAYTLVRTDRVGQVELARQVFGADAGLTRALERFVAEDSSHFAFDERHFATLRALLVLHARPASVEEDALDFPALVRALYATSALLRPRDAPAGPTRDLLDWVGFLLRGGAYYTSRAPMHTLALAYSLWVDLVARADTHEHADFCDVDEWLMDVHGLTARELLAIGFGVIANTGILNDALAIEQRAVIPADFAEKTAFADRVANVLGVIAADRAWYAERLRDDDGLPWERTPFEQRPLLQLEGGVLLLVSPQAIWSWVGEGMYFRLLDIARARGRPTRLTGFYGGLVERYVLDLVRSAHPSSGLAGAGRVFGDELSGPRKRRVRTPDVAVDLGEDLVLMEVVSGRLTLKTRVDGDVDSLQSDLHRMLDDKLEQLSQRIQEFLAGIINIGDIRRGEVRRVWPVLVVSEGLVVAEPLWAHIAAEHANAFNDARIKPLTIVDTHELELVMALVEEGHALHDLLGRKTTGGWQPLPVRRWVHDEFPEQHKPRHPALVERNWSAAWTLSHEVLYPDAQRSESGDQAT